MNPEDRVQEILNRRTQAIFPDRKDVVERLVLGGLTFYLGIDPTGPQIHMGHTIPMLTLADLAESGHNIILLIGDFTARIGDPTDKSSARQALTEEEIEENMNAYLEQAYRILPKEKVRIAYNSEWFSGMTMSEVLKLSSRVTVQQMIQRDMFQERLKQEKPIYVSEFLYPLMQGYDSVALQADGEVGGNDQTFNMLVGRDLSREILGKDKIVLGTKLLVNGDTGKKMSKTEGGLIAINDSPQEIRRKVFAMIPNEMIKTVFELCTRKDQAWIDGRQLQAEEKGDWREYQEELAGELISMYHGESAVADSTKHIKIKGTGSLGDVLIGNGIVSSNSSLRRLVDQGGVVLNGKRLERWDVEVPKGSVIGIGKGQTFEIE